MAKQTTLSFPLRRPLADVTNLKRAASPSSSPSPKPPAKRPRRAPLPGSSPTPATATLPPPLPAPIPAAPHASQWVLDIPIHRWAAALDRLRVGYADKSGSSYPAAKSNSMGCLLAQKGANRAENGYIQVTPVVEAATRGKQGAPKKEREKPHGAHRVAVVVYHSAEAVHRMLFAGEHASHRCHQPTCVNPDHIVVESKADNEARKSCKGLVVVVTRFLGRVLRLRPRPCPHQPPCLFPVEERLAEEE